MTSSELPPVDGDVPGVHVRLDVAAAQPWVSSWTRRWQFSMSGRAPHRYHDQPHAADYTLVCRGKLTAATLETVTFDRPHTIGFRLIRGPVPHITEQFALTGHGGGARLDYSGELGTDFGSAGRW